MTTEEKLKEYILNRYASIREFTIEANMSYSTVDSALKRGIDNSSVSTLIKICKALKISVDALADGEIVPAKPYTKNTEGMLEVEEILADVKNQLLNGGGLTIGGEPADKESINSIVQAMTIGETLAKSNNKNGLEKTKKRGLIKKSQKVDFH